MEKAYLVYDAMTDGQVDIRKKQIEFSDSIEKLLLWCEKRHAVFIQIIIE